MDTKACHILIAIAQKHSFSLAAEELYLSQSVISKTVKKIENEFNVKIFERNAHHVSLTEKGAVILDAAYQIVEVIEHAQAKIAGEIKTSEPCSLWFPRSIGYLMMERISELRKKMPQLSLDISSYDETDRINSDLIIIPEILTRSALYPGYEKRFLAKDQLCFVYFGEELVPDAKLPLTALIRKKLILVKRPPQLSLHDAVLEKLTENQITFDEILYTKNLGLCFYMLSTLPDTCTFLPYSAIGGAFFGIHFLPIDTLNINVDLICMIKNGINLKTADQIIRIIKAGLTFENYGAALPIAQIKKMD